MKLPKPPIECNSYTPWQTTNSARKVEVMLLSRNSFLSPRGHLSTRPLGHSKRVEKY